MFLSFRSYSIFSALLLLLLLSACKKDPIIRDVHENLVVPGNEIPPYNGIGAIKVQNYVNRLYIDLLGRKPTEAELATDTEALIAGKFSTAAKENLVNSFLSQDDYYKRLFEIVSIDLLQGIDSSQILEQMMVFDVVIQQYYATGETILAHALEVEKQKLEDLLSISHQYKTKQAGLKKFYQTLLYNWFYDEINMGSENFVKATFESLLKRNTTASELQQGITMVNGQPSQLFLKSGTNKIDFTEIITNSLGFYEGLTIDWYQTFLRRDPTGGEIYTASDDLQTSESLENLIRNMLITKEYAGF